MKKAQLYIDSAGNSGFWHLVECDRYFIQQSVYYPGRWMIDRGQCIVLMQHTDVNSAIGTQYDTALLSAVLGVDVSDVEAHYFVVEDSDEFIKSFREAEKQLIRSFSL